MSCQALSACSGPGSQVDWVDHAIFRFVLTMQLARLGEFVDSPPLEAIDTHGGEVLMGMNAIKNEVGIE